jgi:hypothetical protein
LELLHYLHTLPEPVIHKDIKPDNIRIQGDNIFLVDFGLAKRMGESTLVRAHTPNYASPEQALGRQTDHRSDLYSLAATLYHLLTGAVPTPAAERDYQLRSGRLDDLLLANDLSKTVSESLALVLNKALAFSPEHRFQSAKEMLYAIRAEYQDHRRQSEITITPEDREMFVNNAHRDLELIGYALEAPEIRVDRATWQVIKGILRLRVTGFGTIFHTALRSACFKQAPTSVPRPANHEHDDARASAVIAEFPEKDRVTFEKYLTRDLRLLMNDLVMPEETEGYKWELLSKKIEERVGVFESVYSDILAGIVVREINESWFFDDSENH